MKIYTIILSSFDQLLCHTPPHESVRIFRHSFECSDNDEPIEQKTKRQQQSKFLAWFFVCSRFERNYEWIYTMKKGVEQIKEILRFLDTIRVFSLYSNEFKKNRIAWKGWISDKKKLELCVKRSGWQQWWFKTDKIVMKKINKCVKPEWVDTICAPNCVKSFPETSHHVCILAALKFFFSMSNMRAKQMKTHMKFFRMKWNVNKMAHIRIV